MMRKFFKKKWIFIFSILALFTFGLVFYLHSRIERTFDAPFPEIHASTDPEVIAKGKYLVYGPLHCAYCHTSKEHYPFVEIGAEPPLSGGNYFEVPGGKIYAPNITPDVETGIGGFTDAELARSFRHGVSREGKVLLPWMSLQNLSEQDLTAIISFLRSQEPVKNPLKGHDIGFVTKVILTFLFQPKGPDETPLTISPNNEQILERGKYLVQNVAGCMGCHTEKKDDGTLIGKPYGGGQIMPSKYNPEFEFVVPNISPDLKSGIGRWSSETFLQRFRNGKIFEGSPMPWAAYNKMDDEDLLAIYTYLMTVEPVEQENGASYRMIGDQ